MLPSVPLMTFFVTSNQCDDFSETNFYVWIVLDFYALFCTSTYKGSHNVIFVTRQTFSYMYIKVFYEDIWKTFVLDGYFKGNHCSWLEPTSYSFHFSAKIFPIHFQQQALLQFHIRIVVRTSSIDMCLNPNCSLQKSAKYASSVFS